MTIENIETYKQQLTELRATLLQDIRDELERSGQGDQIDVTQSVHDHGDESLADLLSDIDLAFSDQHRVALREVDEALVRIADNEYGICVDCGCEIPESRLAANPAAARCIDCQAAEEQGQGTKPSL
jgi:RNA polymerase-binding protein DksA